MKKKRCGDEDLQDYLIQKILLLLPVAYLFRCKCVCKYWRDLIQSSFFFNHHTVIPLQSSSSSSSKFGSFILHVAFGNRPAVFMLSSKSVSDSESLSRCGSSGGCWSSTTGGSNDDDDQLVVLKSNYLGFPLDSYSKKIVGSCNGLVCLYDRVTSGTRPHELSLWNPATGEFRILPESIAIDGGWDQHNYNLVLFGFDVKTKDYKVVLFTSLKPRWNGDGPRDCFCQVQVYSLSTDSWRLLEGISCLPGYPFHYTDSVVYLNGTWFFLAHFFYTIGYPCLPQNDRFIISFDLTNEIITPIQLPDHDRNQKLYLCYLGDKLALFTAPEVFEYHTRIPTYEDFNIWVLNYEPGSSSMNKESWTKFHSFRLKLERPDESSYIGRCISSYIPRGISNDGKFALLETECSSGLGRVEMILYNLVTQEVKRDFLCCLNVMSKAHPYKPSLASVIGGNGAAAAAAMG